MSAVAVATIGPGKFSLDYALFRTTGLYDFLHGWWGLLISAGLGLAGGIGQLVIFWRPPAKEPVQLVRSRAQKGEPNPRG